MASTPFNLDESNGDITKVKTEVIPLQSGHHIIQHHYKLYHPNLNRILDVYATVQSNDKSTAMVDIVGNEKEKNSVGTVEIRRLGRQLANEIGVSHVAAIRTTGARKNIRDTRAFTKIKIREEHLFERVKDDNDEIYHTKDLEHFSQHLIDKHGAHVEMYWTPEGHVNLQTLIVPKELRNQGIASNVISDIKKYSNKNKVKIILNAVPLDNSTKSEQLVDFYKSHGFVENKGRNKDYRIAGNDTMYRNHKENKKKK